MKGICQRLPGKKWFCYNLRKKSKGGRPDEYSSREQDKIKNLCPPVKSGGMLIYPDGSAVYWLEAYSSESDHKNNKKPIEGGQALYEVFQRYQNTFEEKILFPEYGLPGDEFALRRSVDEKKKRSAVYL